MSNEPVSGVILDETIEISLSELCRACSTHSEWVISLVGEGVINPIGNDPNNWRFPGSSIRIVRTARRLETDLGVNLAGVALALDLLEEIEKLSMRVDRLSALDPK
ncbi:MAG: chaperone modulator CbpM [Gammaproteobacteria bacterium]